MGRLRRPHGLRGEILMELETDFPERLRPGATVYLGRHHTRTVIGGTREVRGGLLVRLNGVDTRDSAGQLTHEVVYVAASDRPPLEVGRYYYHQILGCRVVDEHDQAIGRVSEILHTGANDVYVVEGAEGSELLLPAIDSVILKIDPESKLVRVRVPEVFDGADSHGDAQDSGNVSRNESKQ